MGKKRLPLNLLLNAAAWPFGTLGFVILIGGFMFSWVMRDGLGPDSHQTHGEEALTNFLILYVPIASFGLFLFLYGLIIFLLGLFAERLSCLSIGLILMLTPVSAIGASVIFLMGGKPANQPGTETVNYRVGQYTKVIEAIEMYHTDHEYYPSDLTSLIPRYLSKPLDVDNERFELIEYLPLPSFGEPFTFYAWGHNTKQGLRRIWEEWELRYCRLNLCTYPSEYFPLQRINENWLLIYRPESIPLIFRPFALRKGPAPTPLPGWRYPTSEFMFVDVEEFPDGWVIGYPELVETDPTANKVSRHWWQEGSSRSARQVIMRAYNLEDARETYAESLGQIRFLEAENPTNSYQDIDFQSQAADESYITCFCSDWAKCRIVARYQNYIAEMQLDLETNTECNGYFTQGLTQNEIKSVVEAMDARFTDVMDVFYPNNE